MLVGFKYGCEFLCGWFWVFLCICFMECVIVGLFKDFYLMKVRLIIRSWLCWIYFYIEEVVGKGNVFNVILEVIELY